VKERKDQRMKGLMGEKEEGSKDERMDGGERKKG